jgi:hypothetical protein
VQTQLSTLSQVIKTVDPKLHQHLGIHSSLKFFNGFKIYSLFDNCISNLIV